MKPVADGQAADVHVACCPKFTPQYTCGGCSVSKGCQDNTFFYRSCCLAVDLGRPLCPVSATLRVLADRSLSV